MDLGESILHPHTKKKQFKSTFNHSCHCAASPAAGADHEASAAGPTAAGAWGRWLRLERSFLLWSVKVRKVSCSDSTGNATGGREAPEAAAAAESPAAERPRKSTEGFD